MTRHQTSIVRWVRAHVLLTVVIVLTTAIVIKAIYTRPTNSLRHTQEYAIQQAQVYFSHIVDGETEQLTKFADQATKSKLHSFPLPSFRTNMESGVYETKLLPLRHWLFAPVHASFSPSESRMQLIRLERRESVFVMTFAALKESYLSGYYNLH